MAEFELIARFLAGVPANGADLPCGAGDDCAVIAGPDGRDWLVTTDALVEGVHFRRGWADAAAIGRKALSVSASDIAAMGGRPRFYLVSLALPAGDAGTFAEDLSRGMRRVAKEQGMILIGGDTVASPSGVAITITVIGEAASGKALRREGACPGDAIYVTGTFGAAALGLACLKAGKAGGDAERFIQHHLDPVPRIPEGFWIAATGMATALIDVSDGLLADLGHIADASSVGFEVEAGLLPLPPGADGIAKELGLSVLELALSGGEDYELIAAIDGRRQREFEQLAAVRGGGAPLARVGAFMDDQGRRAVRDADGREVALRIAGFDHFAGMAGRGGGG